MKNKQKKYYVSVEKNFSSAHALRQYKGRCENLHGHNWKVKVVFSGKKLNKTGMLIDFCDIKAMLAGVLEKLDHKFLNKIKPFDKINPTAENIAAYIFNQMELQIRRFKSRGIAVEEVKVWESETSSVAVKKGDSPLF